MGDMRAGWGLWYQEERTVEFRRTGYPVCEAAAATLGAPPPQRLAFRLLDHEAIKAPFWSVQGG